MSAFWLKPEDPVRREWFEPLEQLAELVACDPAVPQINPDHFLYAARFVREGYPDVHAYRHLGTRQLLNVDERGDVWRYRGTDSGSTPRLEPYPTVIAALEVAGIARGNLLMTHARPSAVAAG